MNKINDFCIFIISHEKVENQTYKTLMKCNCVSFPTYIVIDDKDSCKEEYINKYGKDKVLIFNKLEYSKKTDMFDNFDFDKVIIYARNACYDFAKKLNYEYFLELDDDYTGFSMRLTGRKTLNFTNKNILSKIIEIYLNYYKINHKIKILAFMQGGDFDSVILNKVKRKAMNALFCSINRPVKFKGRINEDVNAYSKGNSIGEIFISFPYVILYQKTTQTGGGMSETYLNYGTYLKSFYSFLQCPSFVKISILRSPKSYRIHHKILQKYGSVKIISDKYKKF